MARALHRQGTLACLVTDWYAPQSGIARGLLGMLGKRSAASARAAECAEIPRQIVRAFPFRSLLWRWRVRQLAARNCPYAAYTETDAAFARAVAQLKLPPHDIFFGYSYASLELLEVEKKRGVLTIVDQIDPGAAEYKLVAEEMARHPELAGPPPPFPLSHYQRARREWELADVIVVNSEWSREAVIAEGGDDSKIEVLPLGFEFEEERPRSESRRPRGGALQVLWLGQVNVRKGIHYLLEAARLLENQAMEFLVAGPLGILPDVMAKAPKNIRWLGAVPRGETSDLYERSDVFVLPTLSDGFAITQLEALAHGLPVIVTPNCGRVVEDGVTGFIVPPRDSFALAQALKKFVTQPALLNEMAPQCVEASKKYSLAAYGRSLAEILQRRSAKPQAEGLEPLRR